jgi:DNA-binding transcriptional LysR family regulator
MDNMRNIDLNLLVTLEALLTERSVTRAARRLHLSQPSVSVQLRKLREFFADPLLTVIPGGMAPTARALSLLPDLRASLGDMRRLLSQKRSFDPGTARMTWHIGGSDYPEVVILMSLLERLRRSAPGISLASGEGSHARMFKQLDSGAIDLALMALDSTPHHLHHQVLFEEQYVLVVRKGHPALKQRLTPRKLAQLEFVIMSPEGGGFRGVTDVELERLGYQRRVILSTQHFLFIPEVVARTDLAAMLPSRLARSRSNQLHTLAAPLPLPGFEMAMVWHERSHSDPAHEWLRGQVQLSV